MGTFCLVQVLLTHGDCVTSTSSAPDFKVIAHLGDVVCGIADEANRHYGVQFHPEVDLTTNGTKM